MSASVITPATCKAAQRRLHARSQRGYCNTPCYGLIKNTAKNNEVNLTTIDWLRLTVTDLDNFTASLSELVGEHGLLNSADIDIKWSDKGMHGYTRSAKLLIWRDNDYLTIGHFACAEQGSNKGGMFELTGTGCKVLQLENYDLWLELFDLLQYYNWRISRVDVALDLPGEYALKHGYTVPKLFQQAVNEGLFKSDNLRNPNMRQTFSMAGDWSALAVGNLTPETYDPLEHCPAGLTAYVGNRKRADDFFRIYEKGAELLGRMAEPEEVDRAWVRIEHEMSRKSSGRDIPLEVMIRPDHYFAANRSGVRAILDKLREHQSLEKAQQWQRQQFQREKGLLLSKKIHWAKHSYGRLLKTLVEQGIDPGEIIDWLSREDGLKEFVFDITDDGEQQPTVNDLDTMTFQSELPVVNTLTEQEAEARESRLERAYIQLEGMEVAL